MPSFLEPYWLKAGPVLATAVGLGFLIFIHELGHFVVAKRAGVKVEVFSLGVCHFIFSWTWRGTVYALSWLPLGGYVRMAGQQDLAPPPDRRLEPHEYGAKRPLVRLAIISAGVIMNFIAGWLCFSASYMVGLDVEVPMVGELDRESYDGRAALDAGLLPGDRIVRVNGDPVYTSRGLAMRVARERPSTEQEPHFIALTVESQDGGRRLVEVRTEEGADRGLSSIEHLLGGSETAIELSIGVRTERRLTIIGDPDTLAKFPAWNALFRPGERFETVDGQECRTREALRKILKSWAGGDIAVEVTGFRGERRRVMVPTSRHYTIGIEYQQFRKHMRASRVLPDTPAATAGIGMGDEIRFGDGEAECSPDDFSARLQGYGETGLELYVRSPGGEGRKVRLQPERSWYLDPDRAEGRRLVAPHTMSMVVTGVEPGSVAAARGMVEGAIVLEVSAEVSGRGPATLRWAAGERIYGPYRLPRMTGGPQLQWIVDRSYRHLSMRPADALVAGWVETRETLMGTTVLIRKMLSGKASTKGMMGPMGIVGVAYRSAQEGTGHMLWLLGLLGVSLGFFNLLPIPVLDGGHMVFLVYELIARRPPPPRMIEIAQYAGLLLILGLFVFVFYNDIHRMVLGR